MKIGYPCINRSVGCTPNRTFRLKSYSEEKAKEIIRKNLGCLRRTLEFNLKNKLFFFRIGSPLIPFASHPICRFDWQKYFQPEFEEIENFLKEHQFRIGMHPDQFVIINALKKEIIQNSVKELEYHCDLLNLLGLDETAKVQIHIGGVYGDKEKSLQRFIANYRKLSKNIKKRLVIENDHLKYSLKDCLTVSQATGVPVVLDVFHHQCLNNGEKIKDALLSASRTWKKKDGKLMVDYSNQKKKAAKGSHSEHIDIGKFKDFLKQGQGVDFDIMLEIKDKEKSALAALKVTKNSLLTNF